MTRFTYALQGTMFATAITPVFPLRYCVGFTPRHVRPHGAAGFGMSLVLVFI